MSKRRVVIGDDNTKTANVHPLQRELQERSADLLGIRFTPASSSDEHHLLPRFQGRTRR